MEILVDSKLQRYLRKTCHWYAHQMAQIFQSCQTCKRLSSGTDSKYSQNYRYCHLKQHRTLDFQIMLNARPPDNVAASLELALHEEPCRPTDCKTFELPTVTWLCTLSLQLIHCCLKTSKTQGWHYISSGVLISVLSRLWLMGDLHSSIGEGTR